MLILLQRPHATHFIFAQRLQRGLRDSDNGERLAQRVEHLGAVAILAVAGDMVFHQFHNVAALQPLLAPYPDNDDLFLYPVSPLVNNANNEGPELIVPTIAPQSALLLS